MSIARASLWMASGTIVSRILGLVRTVMLAAAIGITNNEADAFGVANQLPNNVYAIIVGGLLNAVLVPQIVRAKVRKDGGQGYIDGLLTVIITVFAFITLIATLAAPVLVRLYTSGWDSHTLSLATAFAYWCLPQLFFYGLYSILGEVLNARSSFGPYMWAPVLNNIVAIIGLAAFMALYGGVGAIHVWHEQQITLLAGSATLGVASQALILFFFWRKIGLRFTFNFKLRGLGLRPALKAASWTLAMLVITQLGGLIQTNLTSSTLAARSATSGIVTAGIASVAVAGTAWLIFMIPHSVGTVSIATAYFTRMSEHAHAKNFDALKTDVVRAVRSILALSAIAAIVMIVLALPIGAVFSATYQPAVALGTVLIAMMIGLIPFSVNFMLQRVFYALEDTKSPFVFTTIQIVVFVIGSYICSITVQATALVAAISLVMSLSFAIQALIAYLMLSRRIGKLSEGHLVRYGFQVVFAAIIAGLIGAATLWSIGGVTESSYAMQGSLQALLGCVLVGGVSVIAYVAVLWFAKNDEVRSAVSAFRGILRR
ncbi:MAG: murein biosynthesis integral membrane protein MurJ [Micrococcales bacterium]